MLKTGFIGAGTTGTALAVRLSQKGWPVVAVSSRTLSSAQKLARRVSNCQAYPTTQELADVAEMVFITTPDDVIAEVCGKVQWHKGQSVLHCSGAHSVDILEPAEELGAAVGSFHPLQTFADVDQATQHERVGKWPQDQIEKGLHDRSLFVIVAAGVTQGNRTPILSRDQVEMTTIRF